MKTVLERFRRYLSFFIHRGSRNWRTTFLRARIHELEQEENADIKYLRWQLIKLRAENTRLESRGNEICAELMPLFHMPVEELRQTACRYQVMPLDGGAGWRWSWSTAYSAAASWRRRPSERSGTPCCMPRCCKRRSAGPRTICRAHGATASIWNQPNCR